VLSVVPTIGFDMTARTAALTFQLILMLLFAPGAARAGESYDNCTDFITSVPTVISTQGVWCLKQDVATAITLGNAIGIATNNVTVDCNGFKLGGLAAGVATGAYGIAGSNRLNATVRHCNIRGFLVGVSFTGATSGGHVVEDNRFDGNTYVGVQVEGDGSVVQRNRIFDTGGNTLTPGAVGIATQYSVDVMDNTVSGVASTVGTSGNVFGVNASANTAGRIIGNGVRGLVPAGAGASYGIYAGSAVGVSIRDNDIHGTASGIGLHCTSSNSHARGNLVINFTVGLDTCNDDGGNVTAP
jgi:hypothetical protein